MQILKGVLNEEFLDNLSDTDMTRSVEAEEDSLVCPFLFRFTVSALKRDYITQNHIIRYKKLFNMMNSSFRHLRYIKDFSVLNSKTNIYLNAMPMNCNEEQEVDGLTFNIYKYVAYVDPKSMITDTKEFRFFMTFNFDTTKMKTIAYALSSIIRIFCRSIRRVYGSGANPRNIDFISADGETNKFRGAIAEMKEDFAVGLEQGDLRAVNMLWKIATYLNKEVFPKDVAQKEAWAYLESVNEKNGIPPFVKEITPLVSVPDNQLTVTNDASSKTVTFHIPQNKNFTIKKLDYIASLLKNNNYNLRFDGGSTVILKGYFDDMKKFKDVFDGSGIKTIKLVFDDTNNEELLKSSSQKNPPIDLTTMFVGVKNAVPYGTEQEIVGWVPKRVHPKFYARFLTTKGVINYLMFHIEY